MGYLLSLQTIERGDDDRARNALVSTFSVTACLSTTSTSIC
ncbi:hypothetical protein ABCS02_10100 [Microbacterium sp. X-17]